MTRALAQTTAQQLGVGLHQQSLIFISDTCCRWTMWPQRKIKTGLSPGYQIVSLFGSFQTRTHAKREIHWSVALTFGAKPWKLQKFSTVSLLSLSTVFSVKSTAKWVTKKCSEWLCFLCPVQCTFLFVWDKNHYMPQQTAKNKIK